ncbi:MAG: DUF1080 domain-containing protein [Kiritimatiellae bacterium]|nr:DUF1080 domain-containing protein [Kiritimatiellia bacterium]
MKLYHYTVAILLISLIPGVGFSSPKKSEWIVPFNGSDLKGWKVHTKSEYETYGGASVKDGAISFQGGSPYTAISLQGTFPSDNYELELTAKRTSGQDIFCGLLLPVGTNHVSMIMGGWGNWVVGLSCIDDMVASDNDAAHNMSFDNDRWYKVRVRVTPQKFQAWIDDKQVINLDRKGRKISPYPGLEVLAPFGLFTWDTSSLMKDMRYRSLQ